MADETLDAMTELDTPSDVIDSPATWYNSSILPAGLNVPATVSTAAAAVAAKDSPVIGGATHTSRQVYWILAGILLVFLFFVWHRKGK